MRHPPVHDTPRISIDDEGRAGEPPPRRHIEPAPEWWNRGSDTHNAFGRLTLNSRCTRSSGRSPCTTECVVFARRPRTAPCSPIRRISRATLRWDSGAGVQRATATPLSAKLAPDLAHPVDPEVLLMHPTHFPAQPPVATHPPRRALRLPFARLVLVVRRWGARHLRAHRPDPVSTTMGVDERHHHLARRSCSARANGGGVVCRR